MQEQSDTFKLRFAVMCNNLLLQKWETKALEQLNELDYVRLELLIIKEAEEVEQGFFKKWYNYPYRNLFYRVYRRFRKIEALAFEEYESFRGLQQLGCKVIQKGKYIEYLADKDIQVIKELQLDFIVRFGFNILKGEILNVPQYGVWSYHHSDEKKYRGGPPVFWEIYKNDPVTGAILQRLTEKIDGGVVLQKGHFKTVDHSYVETLNTVLYESAIWLKKVCIDLKNNSAYYLTAPPSNSTAPMHRFPRNNTFAIFLIKLFRNKLRFHYRDLFRAEDWAIGVVKQSLSKSITEEEDIAGIDWITSPKGSYYADPFFYRSNGKEHILFENYTHKTGKANISKIQLEQLTALKDSKLKDTIAVLEGDTHYSYPFVLDDNWFMPENYQQQKLSLYSLATGKEEQSILRGKGFVDSSIVKFENKYWLFCTHEEDGSNFNLFVYHSNELLGPYKEHANNPVKTDIQSARPGGVPFVRDGILFRPSQDCSTRYGSQLVINKVTKISPYTFEEEKFKTIAPIKDSRFNKGLHTISGNPEFTVIDAKRYVFNWSHFKRRWMKKIFH